jgi:hypothetical protein
MAAGVLAAPAASALNPNQTTATFTLANGTLSVSAPAAATLSTWSQSLVSGNSVTGPLGTTTVTDNRNSTAGWTVAASSTAFSDGAATPHTIPASKVTIEIPTLAGIQQTVNGVTGNLSAGLFVAQPGGTTGSAGGLIGSLVGSQLTSLLGGLLGNANNAISYTPSVTVTVPADTPNGTYTATITQTAT